MIASLNSIPDSIWFGRLLGILCFSLAVGCLCAMGTYAPNRSHGLTQLRLLSAVGLIVTAWTILFWMTTKFRFVAILLLPAGFYFMVLIFRPMLAQKSRKLRIYLTGCIAFAVLTLCVVYISMIKAGMF
jgi:hypothetical protein